MTRWLPIWLVLALAAFAPGSLASAQVDEEEADWEDEEAEEPSLRAPSVGMPQVDLSDEDEAELEELEAELADEPEAPAQRATPEMLERRIRRGPRTASAPVIRLGGYLRTRGELWDAFSLGRRDAPFDAFTVATEGYVPAGSCGDDPETDPSLWTACRGDRARFANLRLRLQPTLSLSDDVRVHATFDVMDNMVLGSTPDGYAYRYEEGLGFVRADRVPGVPLDSFTTGQNPQQGYRNSIQDSLYVRHVWAEVTNRTLGTLRFGRMPAHHGLGLLWNDGSGIDQDFSSDVDRVEATAELAGFRLSASFDFGAQGVLRAQNTAGGGLTFWDATPQDDLRQFHFQALRLTSEDERRQRLARGDWVLQGGIDFTYRTQFLTAAGTATPFPDEDGTQFVFARRGFRSFVPDLWGRFEWKGLRLEVEAAFVAGTIRNLQPDVFGGGDKYLVRQMGIAFEGEYRLLEDQLSIRLHTGYATGDPDVDGLSDREDTITQLTQDRTLSHFSFHPAYRIDLILWRNLMGRVAGAWYLRPGVTYDLVKTPTGQRFGASFDLIYSRAAQEVQTYGSNPNLGLELNAGLHYRSEDGPGLLDGFHVLLQYGVLFPLEGLAFVEFAGETDRPRGFDLRIAQAARLVLGVQF
ncbi:MAG: TIGR04551 family protein [Polyangiales bacterium]|nr:TIGR04551 family protein [Sandaracinus sp.]